MPSFMTFGPAETLYQAALRALKKHPELEELKWAVDLCREAMKERREFAKYVREARKCTNDELEIDDVPVVSVGMPDGVWVSAWIHVANMNPED